MKLSEHFANYEAKRAAKPRRSNGRFFGDVIVVAVTVLFIYFLTAFTLVGIVPFVGDFIITSSVAMDISNLGSMLSVVIGPFLVMVIVMAAVLLAVIVWVWKQMVRFVTRPIKTTALSDSIDEKAKKVKKTKETKKAKVATVVEDGENDEDIIEVEVIDVDATDVDDSQKDA